jgi:hypothetical protein
MTFQSTKLNLLFNFTWLILRNVNAEALLFFLIVTSVMVYEGVHRRIILKWIFERVDGAGMDWINLVQDRDRWQAVVNTVTNLRVP